MAFTRIQELVCITNDEAKSNPLYPTLSKGKLHLVLKKERRRQIFRRYRNHAANFWARYSWQKKLAPALLLYRHRGELEVFLVHPGGPFWAKKDAGAWTIPKGEIGEGEDPLEAAKREFVEETGFQIEGEFTGLDPIKQSGGKIVQAWAIEADCDAAELHSNLFALEWPPKSGKTREFPEVDRAAWFTIPEARTKILAGQVGLIDQLMSLLENESEAKPSD